MRMRHIIQIFAVFIVVMSTASAAPSSSKKKKNARPTDAERGNELYERHCVQCHGAKADGKGPMASALVSEMPNLRGVITKETLDKYVAVVQRGKNAMPGFELSFDQHDTRRVLREMIRRGVDAEEMSEEDKDAPPTPPENEQDVTP